MTDEKNVVPPPNTLCPILTAAVMMRPRVVETARVQMIGATPGVPDEGREPEAIACQGQQCMWFVTQADQATGLITGGRCAITMGVVATGMIAGAISAATLPPPKI